MKSAEQWLDEYGQTHRHPVNKRLHLVCVPVIFWSVFAFLQGLPAIGGVSLSWVASAVALVFYASLGWRYFVAMALALMITLVSCWVLQRAQIPLLTVASVLFVIAWIGQFYGHHIEGRKPAFFQDLFFLLIGPLWIAVQLMPTRR